MNLPIWSLPFPASLRAPKISRADFSRTILGDGVFGTTMNLFAGGTLCEVAHLPVASTTVVKKLEEWSHVQVASLPLV
jgi:hypothetical protein